MTAQDAAVLRAAFELADIVAAGGMSLALYIAPWVSAEESEGIIKLLTATGYHHIAGEWKEARSIVHEG